MNGGVNFKNVTLLRHYPYRFLYYRSRARHAQELRECPDVAITHLLASVAPYLAAERSPSPPIPPHLDPGEEDGVFKDEGQYERRMRHLHERRWGAYAWP